MRYFLFVLLFIFTTQGFSKETLMECSRCSSKNGKDTSSEKGILYKWKDSLIGKAKVYKRVEGK